MNQGKLVKKFSADISVGNAHNCRAASSSTAVPIAIDSEDGTVYYAEPMQNGKPNWLMMVGRAVRIPVGFRR